MYILNRDAQARLTISSPLEAHKANTLVFHMVGVDVGFENPTFACLEIDYEVGNIGINHGFQCSNIRWITRKVFEHKAAGRVFKHLPSDPANV